MKTSDTARYRGFESHLLRHVAANNAAYKRPRHIAEGVYVRLVAVPSPQKVTAALLKKKFARPSFSLMLRLPTAFLRMDRLCRVQGKFKFNKLPHVGTSYARSNYLFYKKSVTRSMVLNRCRRHFTGSNITKSVIGLKIMETSAFFVYMVKKQERLCRGDFHRRREHGRGGIEKIKEKILQK